MSHTELEILVALLAGVLSGLLSEIGSVGAFISLPMMISLGLPPMVANGTNRVGAIALYSSAFYSYQMHRSVDVKSAWIVSIPVIIGTIIGSLIAVHISDIIMQWIIVVMTILMVLFTALSPRLTNRQDALVKPLRKIPFYMIVVLFVAGLYCGIVMQAIAYLLFFLLVRFMGVEIEQARGIKFFIAMIVPPFSLVIFMLYGHINWLVAAFLVVGATVGGFMGERILLNMDRKVTHDFILLSLLICLLYLFTFVIKHFLNGITII